MRSPAFSGLLRPLYQLAFRNGYATGFSAAAPLIPNHVAVHFWGGLGGGSRAPLVCPSCHRSLFSPTPAEVRSADAADAHLDFVVELMGWRYGVTSVAWRGVTALLHRAFSTARDDSKCGQPAVERFKSQVRGL